MLTVTLLNNNAKSRKRPKIKTELLRTADMKLCAYASYPLAQLLTILHSINILKIIPTLLKDKSVKTAINPTPKQKATG